MIIRSSILLGAVLLWDSSAWAAVETRSGEGSRPRGVGPEFAKFYKSNTQKTFTCISNPSITIPFSRVNDDYCDCPDGSDEPGTAACASLSPLSPPSHPNAHNSINPNVSLALPGFYCKNKGHRPSYIRFEHVNDGKCDSELCCDGSDEWARVGGIKCEDRCATIGKEWRKAEEGRVKTLQGALRRRKELKTQAARLRAEVESKIAESEARVAGLEEKVKAAESALRETERREKGRVVRSAAGGGKLGVLLGLAKPRVEELRTGLTKTRYQRDAMLSRVTELEDLLAKLKTDYNPNFNDEGVKRAVRGWEDYVARDTDDAWEEAEDRELDSVMAEDSAETGVNWAEFENVDDSAGHDDVAALYQVTAYLPPSLRVWIDDKLSSLRQLLIENGVLADPSSASTSSGASESKPVAAARKTLTDTQNDLNNLNNDLTRTRDDLASNYGPDDIFRALKSTCISKASGEYTYELCFMGQVKQKGKGDTNLGNFVGFDTEDDEEGGGGNGRVVVMKHENGQHCWNGPNRSCKVVLRCAETEEIIKVSESEKCVYRMEVGTSVVCGEGGGEGGNGGGNGKGKDEL